MKISSFFLFLSIFILSLDPTCLEAQLKGIDVFGGGEISSFNLNSTENLSTLHFAYGFDRSSPEAEQSGMIGVGVDWRIRENIGLRTSIDYGRVIYALNFTDDRDVTVFGPENRDIGFDSERYDFLLAPQYSLAIDEDFEFSAYIGAVFSLVPNSGLGTAEADSDAEQVFVDINNDFLRSFGQNGWKVATGFQFNFKRLGIFAIYKHQFTSATFPDRMLDIPEREIQFKTYPYSVAFGLSYRLFQR